MALTTPTTQDINDNIIAQLEATLNQTIPLLPKSFLRVLAKTLAAVYITLYKYGGFMFKQIFVATASISTTDINGQIISPLIEWGRLIGVGDPIAATQAELIVDVTVELQGGTLTSNTQLLNAANGVTYITIGDVALSAATVQATIRAVADQSGGGGAGEIGNLEVGDTVSFVNSVADVARETTVASQTVTGADGESEAAYRQRVIDRFQKRPQGGSLADYELWAEEVAGILNAYPYTGDPGEVNVYVESSTEVDGIATPAQITAVEDAIELVRPANAFVNVDSITRQEFEVTVTGLAVDNPSAVQADIDNAVVLFFLDAEPFIVGLTVPPRKDQITSNDIISIVTSVVRAANGTFTTATFDVAGVGGSLNEYVLQEGEKAKLESAGVTYA